MQFRKIEENDRTLLRRWLDKEEICRWFGDGDFWLEEFFYEREQSFMVYFQGQAIGFCRYTRQIPEEYIVKAQSFAVVSSENQQMEEENLIIKLLTKTTSTYSNNSSQSSHSSVFFLDYALCDEKFLGKGLGSRMLQLLMKEAMKEACDALFASSSLKNIPSCSLLERQGFTYIQSLGLFYYKKRKNPEYKFFRFL